MDNRLANAFKAVEADQQKAAQAANTNPAAQPQANSTATATAEKPAEDNKRISDFVKELSKDIKAYSKSKSANVTDINFDSKSATIQAKYADGDKPELDLKVKVKDSKEGSDIDLNLDLNYKNETIKTLKPLIDMLPADKQGLVKGILDAVLSMGLVQMISSLAAMFSNPFGSLGNFNPLAAMDTATPPVDLKKFFESDMAKSFMNSDMGKQLKGLVEEASQVKEKAAESMKQSAPQGNANPNLS